MTTEHTRMTWRGVRIEDMTKDELIEAMYECAAYIETLHETNRQTLEIMRLCNERRK